MKDFVEWSFQQNSTGGGSGGTQTLQQVLNFNHDLVNGNNFQGTCAGVCNTGNYVINKFLKLSKKRFSKFQLLQEVTISCSQFWFLLALNKLSESSI